MRSRGCWGEPSEHSAPRSRSPTNPRLGFLTGLRQGGALGSLHHFPQLRRCAVPSGRRMSNVTRRGRRTPEQHPIAPGREPAQRRHGARIPLSRWDEAVWRAGSPPTRRGSGRSARRWRRGGVPRIGEPGPHRPPPPPAPRPALLLCPHTTHGRPGHWAGTDTSCALTRRGSVPRSERSHTPHRGARSSRTP